MLLFNCVPSLLVETKKISHDKHGWDVGVFVSSRKADQTSRCAVSHIKKWDILLVHGMQSQVEQFSLPLCHYHTFITSIFKSLLWQIDLKVIDERLQLFTQFCCLKKQVKQGKTMPKSGLHMRIIDYLAVHRGPLNCRSSECSKYQQNQEKENWLFSCTACNKVQASSLSSEFALLDTTTIALYDPTGTKRQPEGRSVSSEEDRLDVHSN